VEGAPFFQNPALVLFPQMIFLEAGWPIFFTLKHMIRQTKHATLITIKASSAALPSFAPRCGVWFNTPHSSLLGALHLKPSW
jgi:hypothetical protein